MKKLESLSNELFNKLDNNSLLKVKGGKDVQTYVVTGCKDGTTSMDPPEDDGNLSMIDAQDR
jgi:hypothetical protein